MYQEFDRSKEKPICIDCYHDLEFDGFANYHCNGCDGWFTEEEVLRFQD
jgi:tRNA(Ile2) C34 agmatinyltransferase TiaS